MKEVTSYLEIRHLPRQVISELGNILQINHSWRDVMGLVPGTPWLPGEEIAGGVDFPKKYTSENISLVAEECARDGRTGLEVLIEEWGTSGRIRPKVLDLIHILQKAGLKRAALYLEGLTSGVLYFELGFTSEVEQLYQLSEQFTDAPCCKTNKIIETDKVTGETLSEVSTTSIRIVEPRTVACMSPNTNVSSSRVNNESDTFSSLSSGTVPFVPCQDIMNGIKFGIPIGEGAFGSVYRAHLRLENEDKIVAIKILSESEEMTKPLMKKEKIFKTEVEILSKCTHDNIIKLEGYSYSSEDLYLVYMFMENGSLYDRLACSGNSPPLLWKLRLSICAGTAEGIVYLHTTFKPPLVHRDIKSPNILLDRNFIPKLGDFGIVRLGGRGKNPNTVVRTTPIGTEMYMAPEAFRGDVSVKMDTFSFAIVVLELLTGLPFFDEERENRDLLLYIEEYEDDKIKLLDSSAGSWDISAARKLFEFSEICTKDKRERPDMVQALDMLRSIFTEIE